MEVCSLLDIHNDHVVSFFPHSVSGLCIARVQGGAAGFRAPDSRGGAT